MAQPHPPQTVTLLALAIPRDPAGHASASVGLPLATVWVRSQAPRSVVFSGVWVISTRMSTRLPRPKVRLGLSTVHAGSVATLCRVMFAMTFGLNKETNP